MSQITPLFKLTLVSLFKYKFAYIPQLTPTVLISSELSSEG